MTDGEEEVSNLAKAATAAGFQVLRYACTDPRCNELTEMIFAAGPNAEINHLITSRTEMPCVKCGGTVRRFEKSLSEVESARIPWSETFGGAP